MQLAAQLLTDKFKTGNIVAYAKPISTVTRNSISYHVANGATALVLGYTQEKLGPNAYSPGHPYGDRFVQLFWLDAKSGDQQNGGYYDEDFNLVSQNFNGYSENRARTTAPVSAPASVIVSAATNGTAEEPPLFDDEDDDDEDSDDDVEMVTAFSDLDLVAGKLRGMGFTVNCKVSRKPVTGGEWTF